MKSILARIRSIDPVLNLHDFAPRAAAVGLGLAVGVPSCLYAAQWLLGLAGVRLPWLLSWMRISFGIGAALLVGLAVLIGVEQVQNHYLYRRYLKERQRPISAADGDAECPFCGNRKVRDFEKYCSVCGKELR
jgi:hypothetical protein